MSNMNPSSMHTGIFVRSRLPVLAHRVVPSGVFALHTLGLAEAAVIGMAIGWTIGYGDRMSLLVAGGLGAGAYHMAPP
jgi:hypothetical protein